MKFIAGFSSAHLFTAKSLFQSNSVTKRMRESKRNKKTYKCVASFTISPVSIIKYT